MSLRSRGPHRHFDWPLHYFVVFQMAMNHLNYSHRSLVRVQAVTICRNAEKSPSYTKIHRLPENVRKVRCYFRRWSMLFFFVLFSDERAKPKFN